jgi:hypothetical protein
MQEIYRKDYDGEYVVLNTIIKDGNRQTEKEWIDNPIKNQHISGRAAIMASGESRLAYDVTRLEKQSYKSVLTADTHSVVQYTHQQKTA